MRKVELARKVIRMYQYYEWSFIEVDKRKLILTAKGTKYFAKNAKEFLMILLFEVYVF
jgi:hypothetical protein